jgi:2-polyprenyl-6-methoxyphenol hydroxylase-like FAD-dependent oxidoreductase
MATTARTKGHHAVVIGASMAGMLAARALADFFERVTIIERDTLPPLGEHRKGVPQGRHTHALLPSGQSVLDRFFPGLTNDLNSMGAPLIHRDNLRWYDGGGYHCRLPRDDQAGIGVSRPLLEGYVRQRLRALSNVAIVERCDALGLITSGNGTRVVGLRTLSREPGSAEEVLEADLTVDASGRGSRTPRWLEELGYQPPEEELITVDFGYMTRLYRRSPDDLGGAKVLVVAPTLEERRRGARFGGVMVAQEGDRWTITLGAYAGAFPPGDEEGFLAAARSLPAPDIYEIVSKNEPLSDFMRYQFPANQRRRYEKLARFPEGFLVFGDAICSFNPVYGQGMSVAALEAIDLQLALRGGLDGLWRRFFLRAAKTIDNPWQIVATGDLRNPEVQGKRTRSMQFINWYMSRLHVAARRDPAVASAFNRVASLQAPPASVMRPGIALRVLRGNLRRSGVAATTSHSGKATGEAAW